jgi:hypothetical protein
MQSINLGLRGIDTEMKKQRRVRKYVNEVIFQSGFMEGMVRNEMIRSVIRFYRQQIYSPWKILHEMDKEGIELSLEGWKC